MAIIHRRQKEEIERQLQALLRGQGQLVTQPVTVEQSSLPMKFSDLPPIVLLPALRRIGVSLIVLLSLLVTGRIWLMPSLSQWGEQLLELLHIRLPG